LSQNCQHPVLVQPIPLEEQNAPGFYYIVRWRRIAENLTSMRMATAASTSWGAEFDLQERTIDAATDMLTIAGQPVYRSYEMVVLAANEVGEAAARPTPVIGYSSEAGTTRDTMCIENEKSKVSLKDCGVSD